MPRKLIRDKRKYDVLTHDQLFELLCGPRSDDAALCAFPDDGERRAAWRLHGVQVAELAGDVAPWALREYGAPPAPVIRHGVRRVAGVGDG
jgi:hypothetical protein